MHFVREETGLKRGLGLSFLFLLHQSGQCMYIIIAKRHRYYLGEPKRRSHDRKKYRTQGADQPSTISSMGYVAGVGVDSSQGVDGDSFEIGSLLARKISSIWKCPLNMRVNENGILEQYKGKGILVAAVEDGLRYGCGLCQFWNPQGQHGGHRVTPGEGDKVVILKHKKATTDMIIPRYPI